MANIISSMKITNPIKEMVSKSKKRYMDDGYNLDLSCKCSPFLLNWKSLALAMNSLSTTMIVVCITAHDVYRLHCFVRVCVCVRCRLRASHIQHRATTMPANGRTCDINTFFEQRVYCVVSIFTNYYCVSSICE